MKHLMIDLETLGVNLDCVILSVGAIIFDDDYTITAEDYQEFRIEEQIEMGRKIEPSTLKWWANQSLPMPVHGCFSLVRYLKGLNDLEIDGTVWSRGNFDVNIIEHAVQSIKRTMPWKFYQVRDHRTLFPGYKSNTHNALEDSQAQLKALQLSQYNLETGFNA